MVGKRGRRRVGSALRRGDVSDGYEVKVYLEEVIVWVDRLDQRGKKPSAVVGSTIQQQVAKSDIL